MIGRTAISPIGRSQTGRSPSILPRGEAVCASLYHATLGAERPPRSAPLFAGQVA